MTERKEFFVEEKKDNSISQAPKVINRSIFMAKQTAPFSIAIDKAINDDKQAILDFDEVTKTYMQNAIVIYDNKNKDKTEVVFKNFFDTMPEETFEEFRKVNKVITRDSGAYNTFAKKVKHVFEGKLWEQYSTRGNTMLEIRDKDLARLLGKPQSYISANMPMILDRLADIHIKSFRVKRKQKNEQREFDRVNIIESVSHRNGTSYLLFGQLYAHYLSQWGFTQYPLELLSTDDRKYKLAFDIGSYISEMRYYNRTKVKIRSIYERVTAIPRYEDVRDNMNRKYQERIYKPFEDNIEYLNSFATFNIEFENTDYFTLKDNIDFEKWLDTNMIITWKIDPNYNELEAGRNEARKKAQKKKRMSQKKKENKGQAGEQLSF